MIYTPKKSLIVVVGWGIFFLIASIFSSFLFINSIDLNSEIVVVLCKGFLGLVFYAAFYHSIEFVISNLSIQFGKNGVYFTSPLGAQKFVSWNSIRKITVDSTSISIVHSAGKIVFARAIFERYDDWAKYILTAWQERVTANEKLNRRYGLWLDKLSKQSTSLAKFPEFRRFNFEN